MYYHHFQSGLPPTSPPWGMRLKKLVTMTVPFKPDSFVIASVPNQPNKNIIPGQEQRKMVVCNLIPAVSGQWLAKRRQRMRVDRVKKSKERQKRKSLLMKLMPQSSPMTQLKLKRLHRGFAVKAKKQEIFDKWRRKHERRLFSRSLLRSRSESPVRCPFWNCYRRGNARKYNYRMGYYNDEESFEGYYNYLRNKTRCPRSRSRVSAQSVRSRSPVIIRPTKDDTFFYDHRHFQ